MGRLVSLGAVVALVAAAGCAGDDDGQKADRRAAPAPDARVSDRALGYALTLPRGWTDSQVPPGATRPFGGGGRGCALGLAGILGDTRGDRLVAFARRTATRRAPPGTMVRARAVRAANVQGAAVAITARAQAARSALFVTAGGGVAVTCRVPAGRAAALDRDLALLFSSLRLRRDPVLERAQPRAAAVPGVQGVTVRRVGTRVVAEVRTRDFERPAQRVRSVIAALARALPGTDIGVNAVPLDRPRSSALGRFLGGSRAGTIQVPPGPPQRFTLD